MAYTFTTATKKISSMKARLRVVPGGTSASKTVSIILWLIHLAQSDKTPTVTSIVSQSIPHSKRGCQRDFMNILQAHGYWKDANWNATDFIYTMETGSIIEFFSTDSGDKLRGARRDRLFMNEITGIPFDAFTQLEVRTKDFVYMDFNPSSPDMWYYTEIKGKRNDVEEITLTFRDNEALDQRIIDSIMQRKGNASWWRVYADGLPGEIEGRIYKDWKEVDEIPHEARLVRRGLDFGYTIDPTSLVDVYRWNGAYIIDELVYQRGMSNRQIADVLNAQEDKAVLCIGDSAEPKSIDELKSYGVNIVGSQKGPGSVLHGIQKVQDQRIFVTKRSLNVWREFRNYLFLSDKNGKLLSEPDHQYSHSMDAIRYALETLTDTPLQAMQTPPSNPTAYKYGFSRRNQMPL